MQVVVPNHEQDSVPEDGTPAPGTDIDSSPVADQTIIKIHKKAHCRYGRGCTHISDSVHCDKFWHPIVPRIEDDQMRTHYICNECGYSSQSLHDLQLHLQRKTAWSNLSLVGCRISCLIDFKEWHEGYVSQFHRVGKHLVKFRISGESKWMDMTKAVFYILERPALAALCHGESEFKEGELAADDYLAPIEDNWVYVEDISLDFAFAQSVLFKVYGSVIQETGHKTRGHTCLTDDDKDWMAQTKGSFLYGELLPRGANKAFGSDRLNVADASTIFDLGMGTGKILIQAFLQYRNLQYVYGVELSSGRYSLAEEAVLHMVDLLGRDTFRVQNLPGRYIIVTELLSASKGRVLHMECGDMFDVHNIEVADVVMMETDVPTHLQGKLCELLSRMHEGARLLSYLDLRRIWSMDACPLVQLPVNKYLSDRFPTSWSVQRGHHFYLWVKVLDMPSSTYVPHDPSSADFLNDDNTGNGKKTQSRWSFPFMFSSFQLASIRRSDQNFERVIPLSAPGLTPSVESSIILEKHHKSNLGLSESEARSTSRPSALDLVGANQDRIAHDFIPIPTALSWKDGVPPANHRQINTTASCCCIS